MSKGHQHKTNGELANIFVRNGILGVVGNDFRHLCNLQCVFSTLFVGTQVQFMQAKDIETIQTKNKYFLQNYAFYFSFSRPTDNFEDVSPTEI